MLRLDDVSASYRGLRALQGVSLEVARGEIVAVVGANGAGKSTLLKSIAGQVATEGSIEFEGQSLRRLPAHRITRLGVSMVPEGRRLFPRLSVEDNLRLGAYAKRGADRFKPLELVFSLFPRLQERLPQRAETLSGGEQQMLAIGRALMTQPRFLMLDEPSQGIMPRLVDDILAAVTRIRELGVTVLLVEQRLVEALAIADRAYVLQTGRIVLSGPAAEIAGDDGGAQGVSGDLADACADRGWRDRRSGDGAVAPRGRHSMHRVRAGARAARTRRRHQHAAARDQGAGRARPAGRNWTAPASARAS